VLSWLLSIPITVVLLILLPSPHVLQVSENMCIFCTYTLQLIECH